MEVFNEFARQWSDPTLGMHSKRVPPLSNELRRRLAMLGQVHDLSVSFPTVEDPVTKFPHTTVLAMRTKKKGP